MSILYNRLRPAAKLLALLLCLLQTGLLSGQSPAHEVKGVIKDAAGNPVPGVSVVVKGIQRNNISAGDGSFRIQAAKGEVLVFSAISFESKEVPVTDALTYNVTLSSSTTNLGDVVVVGYGKQSRRNLTSAISSVKQDDLNKGAISDVGQLLQGKVPGLNITRSGDPNRAAAIILRGASTLREGAQSPLFVIDGIPGGDISSIAPDDIVTMDVLKDASATAIYGNRAANGVIMVTTRRPKQGQMQVSYSGYVALEKVANQYNMMSAPQLRDYLSKQGQSLAPEDDLGANTNWQDAVQRKSAVSHNHNISFGGGNEHTIYSASLNYFDQQGVIRTSGLNRTIARLTIEQKAFRDKLKLGLSVTNTVSNADQVPYRNTVLTQMLTYLPSSPVKNANGTYFDNFNHTGYYNPVSLLENATENLKTKNLLGSFTAQAKLPFGFTYDLNLSYQSFQTTYGAYYNSYYTENYSTIRSTPDPPTPASNITLVGENGYAVRNTYENTSKILETFLTWDKTFGEHNINAVLGYSWQENINGNGFQATSTNFPVDNISYNNLGLGNSYGVPAFRINYGDGNAYQKIRLISNFARLNYNYKNKYLVQGSIRQDGSSAFGKNNRWGYFPSVGAAWRITQENFMEDQSLFDELKLRVSYGVTGNSLGFNPLTPRFILGDKGTYYYNGTWLASIGSLQDENPDLRWEKTATSNIGLDFSILQGKINGAIEFYNKRTSDLIYSYPVDILRFPTGVLVANVGEMTNKGIELSLNATPVSNKNFSWTTGLNLARNVNKLVTLSNPDFTADSVLMVQPDGGGQTGATLQILATGLPIGSFYTLQYEGKDANGVSQYLRGDGTIGTSTQNKIDYHLAGNAQPKLLLGWSNSFRYRNLDLNIFMRSVLGNKIFNATLADLYRPNAARLTNIPVEVAGESVNDVNSYRYSSRFVESGSYLRLDNATLGYTFRNISKDIKSLRLYVSGNNLFVITSYRGIDPEINQGGIAPGVDVNNFYPKTRTFMFGVNASF